MKKHWTQTPAGRKRMVEIRKQRWAKPKQQVIGTSSSSQGVTATVAFPFVNGSVSKRIQQASTVAELEEVRAFLDLRDELLARLP